MSVLKFGGTSMGSATAMEKVCGIIQKKISQKEKLVVVCSAISGITDQLLEIGNLAESGKIEMALALLETVKEKHFQIAREFSVLESFEKQTASLFSALENLVNGVGLIRELSEKNRAYLVSFGEKLSTRILAKKLHLQGISAIQLDSVFIKTQGHSFWEDEVDWDETQKAVEKELKPLIEAGKVPIISGFFGTNVHESITLLGRGGSDFAGAILAVCLQDRQLEIWTDVDGFLSADPRIVKNACILDEIGFKEVSELCFFGAKVLHPKTIRPVIEKGGEVWIKNTFSPEKKGTKIAQKIGQNSSSVVSISSKEVFLISLDIFVSQKKKPQIFEQLFTLANQENIFIDMIASSEAEISFCIEAKYSKNKSFFEALKKLAFVEILEKRNIVCIVSPEDVRGRIGVAAEIFQAVSESGVSIEMYSQNASEIAQLIVVRSEDAKKVVSEVHNKLIKI